MPTMLGGLRRRVTPPDVASGGEAHVERVVADAKRAGDGEPGVALVGDDVEPGVAVVEDATRGADDADRAFGGIAGPDAGDQRVAAGLDVDGADIDADLRGVARDVLRIETSPVSSTRGHPP
jgi:hypothetical protein